MRSPSSSTRRVWLLVNVLVTLGLLPALFTESGGRSVEVSAAGTLQTVPVSARLERPATTTSTTAAPTTSTTAAPAPAPTTTTTAAPKPAPRPKAAAAPATTTTTAAPKPRPTTTTTAAPKPRPTTTTTAPQAPPAAAGTESGKASWYDHQPGVCAHKTLPMGTVVTISHKGRSTTCTVGDRGPFIEGWIIDLHPQQFEQLAPRSAGVISVTISW